VFDFLSSTAACNAISICMATGTLDLLASSLDRSGYAIEGGALVGCEVKLADLDATGLSCVLAKGIFGAVRRGGRGTTEFGSVSELLVFGNSGAGLRAELLRLGELDGCKGFCNSMVGLTGSLVSIESSNSGC
jgi:hypothetical protein